MRAYGGRVARLQAIYADAARSENREEELDEKEISARLGDWLRTGGKLKETMGASERIGENVHDPIPEDLEGEVGDEIPEESGSATDEGIPNNEHRPRQILKKARCTKYVIVKGAGWGDGGYSGTPENLAPG